MPYAESLIRAIADRHGLSGDLVPLPKSGMVNDAWLIGEGHILRIVNESIDDADGEAAREAAVVPVVRAAGLTVPALVAHDSSKTFAPKPYTIYERAPGELIGSSPFGYEHYADCWRQIGREYAALHAIKPTDALREHVEDFDRDDVPKWLKRAVERGTVTEHDAEDVIVTMARWDSIGGSSKTGHLIHNDLHPWNLMGDPASGTLTAILDWGDAAFGDPARDFAMMPLRCVPAMLEGYAEAGIDASIEIAARAMVVGMSVALFELATPEMSDFDRKWWRMPPGGWDEMKATANELWPELS